MAKTHKFKNKFGVEILIQSFSRGSWDIFIRHNDKFLSAMCPSYNKLSAIRIADRYIGITNKSYFNNMELKSFCCGLLEGETFSTKKDSMEKAINEKIETLEKNLLKLKEIRQACYNIY